MSMQRRDRVRTAIITGLLLLSLILVGLISWQSYVGISLNRQMAEDVLRDYSALAADEYIRRYSIIENWGFFPLLGALAQLPDSEPLPAPGELRTLEYWNVMYSDEQRRETVLNAARLARSFFRHAPTTGALEYAGLDSPAEVITRLRARMDALPPDNQQSIAVHIREGDVDHNFILSSVPEDHTVGFELDNDEFKGWIAYLTREESQPLLPHSLVDGLASHQMHIKVSTLAGRLVHEIGTYDDSMPRVERAFDETNTKGIIPYGGLRVSAGLDPALADELIIGGLPVARMPMIYGPWIQVLGGLWAVAALMIIIAMVLLRRERALAHLRSDFVSRLSHELRTPLTQILMFAETLLLNRIRTADDQQRSLRVIDKEARRLSHMVENILQFSRGQRGSTDLKIQLLALMPMVRDIVDRFRPMMKDGRLRVVSDFGDDVRVRVDPDAFEQMVVNLLDNAVKYSPQGADIDAVVEGVGDRVEVAVADRGAGIARADRQRIFEPYYRSEASTQSAIGGTGIGLAVVQELADLQDVTVAVRDREGGGSVFALSFMAEHPTGSGMADTPAVKTLNRTGEPAASGRGGGG